jgi:hypothetical protein
MTIQTPPWCLHWSSNGELTGPDRQDLLTRIVVQEKGLAGALMSQKLGATETADSMPTFMPDQATALF